MSEEYDTECVQCCGYQDHIEQLEAAISELQCDESYCGIHGKCPQCKAKTLLGSKSI